MDRLFYLTLVLFLFPSLAQAVCPAAPVGSADDRVIQMVAGGDSATQMGSDANVDATEEGAVVYDAANNTLVVCDGTNWITLGGGNTIGTVVESPQLAFGTNGRYAWTHGQGSTPIFFTASLIAIVANNTYSVGDVVPVGASGLYRASDGISNTVGANTTQIWLSTVGAGPLLTRKLGGNRLIASSSQWRLVLKGWW